MQNPHTAISAGQHVVVRDERWTVLDTETFDSTHILRLRGVDRDNRDQIQSLLAPFESISTEGSNRLRRRSRRHVLGAAARAVADATPWTACWTAAHARIDLYDWQMAPALAAVTGTTRILLADDVGLGKTIQAALIIAELMARGLASRVLILTPAAIRAQWAGELEARFGLRAAVFDQTSLATMAITLPPDVNPWRTTPLIVSSIDLVKRPEVRAAIEGVAFDILVVDEAHRITPFTDRGALVDDLAGRTPWIVLATATPHSGDDRAYDFLTQLGGAREPIAVFRRSIRHAGRRRSRLLAVTPTAAERQLLSETWRYARALARTRSDPARLAGGVIARRAASSAAAAARTLSRRLALLTRQPLPVAEPTLPWDDGDPLDDDVADRTIAASGLKDVRAEIAWLRRLVDLATLAADDWSKRSVIHRLLRRTRESLLVFSEYRDVVRQLAASLEGSTSVAMLHGGMSPRERALAIALFNSGRARVLVATDAAGEGLNLHLHCRAVVNIELPWTPLRHEQRIGRVDRLGQTRRVHAISLAHRDSYEELVIARLDRRRQRAASVVGALAGPSPVPGSYDHDVNTVRRLNQLAGDSQTREAEAVYCFTRRTRPRPSAGCVTFLVFLLPVLDASGRLLYREAVCARILTKSRLTRRHLRSLTRDRRVEDMLAAEAARCAAAAQPQLDAISVRLAERVRALTAHVNDDAAASLWQDSLFDRRQEQQARRRAASLAALSEHLSRRLDAVLDLRRVRTGVPRLVAAWQGEPSCFPASTGR